jgi:polyphosphate kinase
MPQLSAEGIHLVRPEEMSGEQERFLEEFFQRTLYPIVTPLAIDPGHPFYLPRLYQGFEIRFCHAIRVTRDADFLISRRREENLLVTIKKGVRERRMGDSVRFSTTLTCPMK